MKYKISFPYGYGELIVKGNKIIDAPPIARWMVGKSIMYVCEWIEKKGKRYEIHKI